MKTPFSLFDLLIIIGITQGIVTSVLLLISKKNSRSNKFLAFALIAFSFLCTKMLLLTLQLWETPTFRYFPNGVELVIAPLIYFYVVSLINSKFRFKWKNMLHFIPFILSQSYSFFVYFSVIYIPELEQKDVIANLLWFNEIKKIEDYLSLISIVTYLVLSYKILKDYRKWLNNTTSDSSFPDFNWLKSIFILSTILGFFLLINLTLSAISHSNNFLLWQVYFIFIASLIYYLGFTGYKQPHYQLEKIDKTLSNSRIIKLSKEKNLEIIIALKKALEKDKVFLNPIINIQQLSKSLEVSESNLSYVINTSFDKNFRNLINKYRIEEVKSKLIDKNFSHLSILGIALECGFNSEASFYRIFKKHTGLSPKEFIQQTKNIK